MSYRNSQPKDKISITFDSDYRTSGTVAAPIFSLNEPLRRVGKVTIDKVVFPRNYYVFNSGNNYLGTISGYPMYVGDGNYTAAVLAATLQTSFRSIGVDYAATTCTYSTSTNKFTFASNNMAVGIPISASTSLAPMLGFTASQNNTVVTSDSVVYDNTFTIASGNTHLVVEYSNTDHHIYITAGNYTPTELATEIQRAVSTYDGAISTFTVTYNSALNKFVFFAGIPFKLKAYYSIMPFIGFPRDLDAEPSGGYVTSTFPIRTVQTSLIIKSQVISKSRQTLIRPNVIYTNAIYELLMNGNDVVYDYPEKGNEINMSPSGGGATFQSIDFSICDDTGRVLSLNDCRWKLYLTFETY